MENNIDRISLKIEIIEIDRDVSVGEYEKANRQIYQNLQEIDTDSIELVKGSPDSGVRGIISAATLVTITPQNLRALIERLYQSTRSLVGQTLKLTAENEGTKIEIVVPITKPMTIEEVQAVIKSTMQELSKLQASK